MRQMTFEETKQVELQILLKFTEFCDKYHLQYFLAYGTLIGAVRHKGFIPWDDDIDVQMPRADYDKLIEIFNKEKEQENIYLVSPRDKLSRHSFVKIIRTDTVKIEHRMDNSNGYLGVDIDVFPIDGQPEDQREFDKFYKKLNKQYRIHAQLCLENKSLKRKIAIPVIRVLCGGKKKILRRTQRIHKKYPYQSSKYVGAIESAFNSKGNRYKQECFSEAVYMEFEGYSFKCPKGYHEILSSMYGDYMQLPPEDKQVTHHKNNTYWKDECYEKV